MLSPTHLRREGEDYEAQILSKAVKGGPPDLFFRCPGHARRRLFPDHHREPQNHGPRRHVELRPPQDIPLQGGFFEIRRRSARGRRVHPPQQGVPRAGGIARSDPFRSVRESAAGPGSAVRCAEARRQLPGGGGGFSARDVPDLPGRGKTSGSGRLGRMCALHSAAFRKERAPTAGNPSAAEAFPHGMSRNCRRERENVRQRRTQAGAKNGRLPKN